MAAAGALVAAYGGYVAAAASAVAAVSTYSQAKKEEDQQEAYNEALKKEAARQYQQLDAVENDAVKEEHAESLQAQRDYLKARSSVLLAASVTGTYGNSVNTAISDLNTGLGQRLGEITTKREQKLDDVDRQAENIQAQAVNSQDNSIKMPAYYSAFSSGLSTYAATSGVTDKISNAYQLKGG